MGLISFDKGEQEPNYCTYKGKMEVGAKMNMGEHYENSRRQYSIQLLYEAITNGNQSEYLDTLLIKVISHPVMSLGKLDFY